VTPEDIAELKREAEDWKTRWGAPMPAGQSQAFATGMLKLIAHIEDLEQSIAEASNERAQGDAWKGGFADNH